MYVFGTPAKFKGEIRVWDRNGLDTWGSRKNTRATSPETWSLEFCDKFRHKPACSASKILKTSEKANTGMILSTQ